MPSQVRLLIYARYHNTATALESTHSAPMYWLESAVPTDASGPVLQKWLIKKLKTGHVVNGICFHWLNSKPMESMAEVITQRRVEGMILMYVFFWSIFLLSYRYKGKP